MALPGHGPPGHPEDARRQGLENGAAVRLFNKRGEIFAPFHFRETPVNKLTRAELDPDSKIAPCKLSACRVEKV